MIDALLIASGLATTLSWTLFGKEIPRSRWALVDRDTYTAPWNVHTIIHEVDLTTGNENVQVTIQVYRDNKTPCKLSIEVVG
jgi:hypothetical protein